MYASLYKKSVLITGGANGIGKAIALKFAELGAKVAIADIDKRNGAIVLGELKKFGTEVIFIPLDLGKGVDVVKGVHSTVEAFGRLDVLINDAATLGRIAPVLELESSDWLKVINTNVNGTFLLSHAAAKQMAAQNSGGSIINILTIQTRSPVPNHSAYVSSKGALQAMTLALAVDLADYNIRVNGIQVGSVFTETFRKELPAKYQDGSSGVPPLLEKEAATLLGRMGRPEEIANVAAFLASDEAGYLTGSILRADGGRAISRKSEPLL